MGRGLPAAPPAEADLPSSITFYLTEGERRAVLARLGPVARGRTRALLIALGLWPQAQAGAQAVAQAGSGPRGGVGEGREGGVVNARDEGGLGERERRG